MTQISLTKLPYSFREIKVDLLSLEIKNNEYIYGKDLPEYNVFSKDNSVSILLIRGLSLVDCQGKLDRILWETNS